MTTAPLTYESSGVRGLGKDKSRSHFTLLNQSHLLADRTLLDTPYYTLYETAPGIFHAKCCDTVGTKVLVAQLAGKHDTLGIDAVAAVVNDVIRCGAHPIALTNVIDAANPTEELVYEIQKGLLEGARQANCPIVGGETAGCADLFADGYVLGCDGVGEVRREDIIYGNSVASGDVIIGLRSSGVHTNGISLARHALFTKWGGKYEPFAQVDGLDRVLVHEVLTPTRIYVKSFLSLVKRVPVKAAVHITGDAYSKFAASFGKGALGFAFDSFSPQPIFGVIQESGHITDEEMFKRFNMGWGFAVVVAEEHAEETIRVLTSAGEQAEPIGRVNSSGKVTISYGGKTFTLT